MNAHDTTARALEGARSRLVGDEGPVARALEAKQVLLGFDGYVDYLYSLVATRESPDAFSVMESMREFATRVSDAAGSSCNVERVLKKKIAGGFGPNIARCLAHLNLPVQLVGMLGVPEPRPLFREFPDNVQLHPVGNPGETVAIEFADGKVMLTDFAPINALTWADITRTLEPERWCTLLEECAALGQGHWALVPNMNDIWRHLLDDVLPSCAQAALKGTLVLVDPADCKKRSPAAIREMLALLGEFEEHGLAVVLSVNDKEAVDVARVIPDGPTIRDAADYVEAGKTINAHARLSYFVIHDPHFATVTTETDHFYVQEGFTAHPRFTTAAGDHFNGGVLAALLAGLTPDEAMTFANAVTAIFVRTGKSPTLAQTSTFLQHYERYVDADLPVFPPP